MHKWEQLTAVPPFLFFSVTCSHRRHAPSQRRRTSVRRLFATGEVSARFVRPNEPVANSTKSPRNPDACRGGAAGGQAMRNKTTIGGVVGWMVVRGMGGEGNARGGARRPASPACGRVSAVSGGIGRQKRAPSTPGYRCWQTDFVGLPNTSRPRHLGLLNMSGLWHVGLPTGAAAVSESRATGSAGGSVGPACRRGGRGGRRECGPPCPGVAGCLPPTAAAPRRRAGVRVGTAPGR